MDFSVFEIIMLVCFGLAWPFSIYRSYVSKSIKGKSLLFLIIVVCGYVAGILNKLFYSMDIVLVLYVINALMVLIDIGLYFRNKSLMGRAGSKKGAGS